jgi:PLP dependent protein
MIKENLNRIKSELPSAVTLVAVSKFHPVSDILEAYEAGQRVFAESRPQELAAKIPLLPNDIQWHFIGHLQSNKLKMVLPYVSLVHSVDTEKLLTEINRYAVAHELKVNCLLEVFIASEETKQGLSPQEAFELVGKAAFYRNVNFCGLMGMASFVEDKEKIRMEFMTLKGVYDKIKNSYGSSLPDFNTLSMGMSNDFRIAVECGSTHVRIGTDIFGVRNY